jgi:hypothetical protein
MRSTSFGLALLLGLTIVGCDRASDESVGQEALVLRSYSAPGRAREVADVLGGLMRFAEGDTQRRVGNARVGPGDQVLVLAPESVHEDLAEVIAAQLAVGPEASLPADIATTYWFVEARPVQGESRYGGRLGEVRSVLEELAEVEGALEFSFFERIDVRQVSGNRAMVGSPKATVRQNASISGDSVVISLSVELRPGPNRFQTVLNLSDGQFLVLGQSSLETRRSDGRSLEDRTLYTIVRAHSPSLS